MAKPSKAEKRSKKLRKRMKRDFDENLELSVSRGDISREAIGSLLKEIGYALTRHEEEHGTSKELRAAGRFLEHLHTAHKKRIAEGQLAQEQHDPQTLARIEKMTAKGKTPEQIAKKLSKEGERITAEGIVRVLTKES